MDDKELYKHFNRPPIPDDLEDRIRANWFEQKTQRQSNYTARKYAFLAASIIGIVIGTILMDNSITQAELIQLAVNDIQSDEKKKIGIALPVASLVKQRNINYPPESMPVEMTKYCNLDGNKTIHLKVAGEKQGTVHLFINEGHFDLSKSNRDEEINESMPWKLINPREDLSVLVLYTKDMNPANVDRLIQTMFYT